MLIHDPYYDVQGVSNSSLRYINPEENGSPVLFKEHWDGKTPSLKTSSLEFGNLLHLAVLEPHLCTYEVDRSNTPDKIRDILKQMYSAINESNKIAAAVTGDLEPIGQLDEYVYAIIEACDREAYGRTWKNETRVNKIMSQGAPYWELLRQTEKFIITENQLELMNCCIAGIKSNKKANDLMFNKTDTTTVYYNELEVYWRDDNYAFPLKGKIDRLKLDLKEKTFTIIDLKTTAKTLGQFKESFEKYRYARQMAFYTTAAQEWLDQNGYKMYEALNPVICAVETKGANRAGLFQLSDQTWFKGVNEKKDLLERLNHHFKNDQWTDDMETDIDQRYFL